MEWNEVNSSHQPELILASEADMRVSTAHSQRDANSSSTNRRRPSVGQTDENLPRNESCMKDKNERKPTQTPDNTPRYPGNLSGGEIVTLMGYEAMAGDEEVEKVLDDDEMFMIVTDDQRRDWETMMKERSQQLNLSKEQHQKWADTFTRRRMFAYSRMRKLQESYKDRAQFFTQLTDSLHKISKNRVLTSLPAHKQVVVEKPLSEPQLNIQESNSIKRNETLLGLPDKHQNLLSGNKHNDQNEKEFKSAENTLSGSNIHSRNLKATVNPVNPIDSEAEFVHLERERTPYLNVEQVNQLVNL